MIKFLGILLLFITTTIYFRYVWKMAFSSTAKPRSSEQKLQQRKLELDKSYNPQKYNGDNTRKEVVRLSRNKRFFNIEHTQRKQIEQLLDAIGWDIGKNVTVVDIEFLQIFILIVSLIVCVSLSLANPIFIVSFLCIPYAIKFPINRLKSIIETDMREIVYQFPDFYDTVYSIYSVKDVNARLRDVVEGYIPNTSPAFRKLLSRFLVDLDGGEEYALELLEKRYQGQLLIHKFSNIMKQRIRGEEASLVTMVHFREMLQTEVDDFMNTDLQSRIKKGNFVIFGSLSVVLGLVIISSAIVFIKAYMPT